MSLKKIIFLLVMSFLCLSAGAVEYRRVQYVYDGDTIQIQGREKVRYLGIDSPEMNYEGEKSEPMANEAKKFNAKWVGGSLIRLEYDEEKKDRHGRILAYVFLKDGSMVNALMVRQGLAHVLFGKKPLRYQGLLLESQRKAMMDRIGIWKWLIEGKEKIYLGNRRSHRFHRPECPFGKHIASCNVILFKTLFDAYWEGYAPCAQCRP